MPFYINPDASYTSGDKCFHASIEVPERPSINHEWVDGAWALNVPKMIADKQSALEEKIQERLDNFAKSVNFDSLLHACITGLQPVGTYRQADGAEFITLRYATWQKAAEIRDAYLAGGPEPTWAEVEAQLPGYPIV